MLQLDFQGHREESRWTHRPLCQPHKFNGAWGLSWGFRRGADESTRSAGDVSRRCTKPVAHRLPGGVSSPECVRDRGRCRPGLFFGRRLALTALGESFRPCASSNTSELATNRNNRGSCRVRTPAAGSDRVERLPCAVVLRAEVAITGQEQAQWRSSQLVVVVSNSHGPWCFVYDVDTCFEHLDQHALATRLGWRELSRGQTA